MVAAFKDLCLDATDALAVARFWSTASGGRLVRQANGDAVVQPGSDVAFPLHILRINQVPETKAAKNRVHLDVHSEPADLVALGAALLADHGAWQVLADPEGNELCVFPRPADVAAVDVPAHVFAICVDSASRSSWRRGGRSNSAAISVRVPTVGCVGCTALGVSTISSSSSSRSTTTAR